MVADSIEISHDGPLTASLTSHGRLIDGTGRLLARFDQTVRVVRDRPILEFDISLDLEEMPQGNPWRSYYAARFACRDAVDEVQRSVGLGSHATQRNRLEAPHFINLISGTLQTTFLTCGLPYHVMVADGQLDSLLVVPGEPARRFRLAVGIGLTSPVQQALAMIQPPQVVAQNQADATPASSWFFSVDAPSVVVTQWQLVRAAQEIVGIRLRLLETSGRRVRFAFRSFRSVAAARKLDFVGNTIAELNASDERVIVELVEHEFCTLELEWQT